MSISIWFVKKDTGQRDESLPEQIAQGGAYHCPRRAVGIPRALSASAIYLNVRAPAF